MAEVYDAWMEHDRVPYDAWAAHIVELVRERRPQASRLLDLGCGTGQLLSRLMTAGFDVAGVDASREMIDRATHRLPEGTPLFVRRLPHDPLDDLAPVDVVTACFDVLNYLIEPGEFENLVHQVGALLPSGGVFFFDLNSRYKLEKIFGGYNTGDDVEAFSYVWRNRYDAPSGVLTAYVTFFVEQQDGLFRRSTEVHRERWFAPEEVRSVLQQAGFNIVLEGDGYSRAPTSDSTMRETWFAQRA